MYEKIVLVTRRTRLAELVARFNICSQARFYLEHAGQDFGDYAREDGLSSVFTLVQGLTRVTGGAPGQSWHLGWEDPRLAFVVREPFVSRRSAASLVGGLIPPGVELVVESRMPTGGVIFSDGVEEDFLAIDAGATARVRAATQRARLVVP